MAQTNQKRRDKGRKWRRKYCNLTLHHQRKSLIGIWFERHFEIWNFRKLLKNSAPLIGLLRATQCQALRLRSTRSVNPPHLISEPLDFSTGGFSAEVSHPNFQIFRKIYRFFANFSENFSLKILNFELKKSQISQDITKVRNFITNNRKVIITVTTHRTVTRRRKQRTKRRRKGFLDKLKVSFRESWAEDLIRMDRISSMLINNRLIYNYQKNQYKVVNFGEFSLILASSVI